MLIGLCTAGFALKLAAGWLNCGQVVISPEEAVRRIAVMLDHITESTATLRGATVPQIESAVSSVDWARDGGGFTPLEADGRSDKGWRPAADLSAAVALAYAAQDVMRGRPEIVLWNSGLRPMSWRSAEGKDWPVTYSLAQKRGSRVTLVNGRFVSAGWPWHISGNSRKLKLGGVKWIPRLVLIEAKLYFGLWAERPKR